MQEAQEIKEDVETRAEDEKQRNSDGLSGENERGSRRRVGVRVIMGEEKLYN